MLEKYGWLGLFRLAKNWLVMRVLFSRARLVRFPIYVRARSFMELGLGLTTGVNVRLHAFAPRGSAPVLKIGRVVQLNGAVHIGSIQQVAIGVAR